MIISDVSGISKSLSILCRCDNCFRPYVHIENKNTINFCDDECKKMKIRDYHAEEALVGNL